MAELVSTRTTLVYRMACPHCRRPFVNQAAAERNLKQASVTIELDEKKNILSVKADCDSAFQGQDRT